MSKSINNICSNCGDTLALQQDNLQECNTCYTVFDLQNNKIGQYVDMNSCISSNDEMCMPEKGTVTCELCKQEWCTPCIEKHNIFPKSEGIYLNFVCNICNNKYLK